MIIQMKSKTIYVCKECGAKSAKWLGRCNSCGAWDSFVEEISYNSSNLKRHTAQLTADSSKITFLENVITDDNYRIITGIKELDRVLGGGIMPGSIVLVGGDPGIGKSTLMLQMCAGLQNYNPLYATGEESLQQIKCRADRLHGIPGKLMLIAETNVEQINSLIKNSESGVVIIDSIQSIYSSEVDSTPGSVIQVRECASLLMQTAKQTGKAIFIIGHVTKDGVIAGPKILEHTVDTVLQFEGEKTYSYRILRSLKNRFGSTNEIGIFEMNESGLKEVENPSELFLAHRKNDESGIAIVAAIEGSRPILLEVQALVSPSGYSVPQRISNGFDLRRLQMILAVLEKRLGVPFRQHDVFVNVAGGVYLNDPAVDLGIAAALISSLRDTAISTQTVFIGEIGLTGEIRQVSAIEQRISEAEKLGFKNIYVPEAARKRLSGFKQSQINAFDRISLALSSLF